MPGSADTGPGNNPGAGPAEGYLRVENATRRYGDLTAVDSLSFSLRRGRILGILGSDGAGKTTLLRMIALMIPPSSGNITIKGLDVLRDRTRLKSLIGYMPQRFGLYPDLTVGENLDFFMDIYGIRGAEREKRRERYLGFSNLLPFVHREAGKLSGGMKQKLGLACVLVHQPEALILDEPTNGVDPISRSEFWDILAAMQDEGMTILVSTAYMDEGERCDRLLVMHKARALTLSAPAEMLAGFADLEEALVHLIHQADGEISGDTFVV